MSVLESGESRKFMITSDRRAMVVVTYLERHRFSVFCFLYAYVIFFIVPLRDTAAGGSSYTAKRAHIRRRPPMKRESQKRQKEAVVRVLQTALEATAVAPRG
jgi:hypothetical protein